MAYYKLRASDFTNERDLLAAIFHAARNRGTGNTGLFGLRMQGASFSYFLQKLEEIGEYGSSHSDVDKIQAVFGKTLFIHLSRCNNLDQAISLVKARQTGLWHKAPDGTEIERTSQAREPVYDATAIAHYLTELTEWDTQWTEWFHKQGVEPLRVEYEPFSADPVGTVNRILLALAVDYMVDQDIELPVAKLADATNRRWAERYLAEKGASPG